jgi:hypothetical protein
MNTIERVACRAQTGLENLARVKPEGSIPLPAAERNQYGYMDG